MRDADVIHVPHTEEDLQNFWSEELNIQVCSDMRCFPESIKNAIDLTWFLDSGFHTQTAVLRYYASKTNTIYFFDEFVVDEKLHKGVNWIKVHQFDFGDVN